MDEIFDALAMRAFLAVGQILDQAMPLQQLDDLSQPLLQAFLRFFCF
jgi:hypothetical protein